VGVERSVDLMDLLRMREEEIRIPRV
jgi:hypothetical protein